MPESLPPAKAPRVRWWQFGLRELLLCTLITALLLGASIAYIDWCYQLKLQLQQSKFSGLEANEDADSAFLPRPREVWNPGPISPEEAKEIQARTKEIRAENEAREQFEADNWFHLWVASLFE
jgi:hypothetical protein